MKRTWALVAVLLVFAMVVAAACSTGTLDSTRTRTQKVQRLDVDAHNTAPAVEVNQSSTGNIQRWEDASTPVARIVDGGDLESNNKLRIGWSGTPDATQASNSVYVKGGLEVDGQIRADGGISGSVSNDLDGGTLTIGGDAGVTLNETTDDLIEFTFGAGTGILNLLTGNLKVGNGTQGLTLNGNDAYVTGTFEVDGATQLDGGVKVTTITGANAETIDNATNGYWDVGAAALKQTINTENLGLPTMATASFTYTAAAGGTITLATAGASEVWLVHDVRVNVTNNFDATGDDVTLNIGRDEDVDGFCVLVDAELQAADTEGTGWDAGWQCQVAATRGVFIDGTGGYILNGTETIDAVIDETSGETITAGGATVYIYYTRIN